MEAERFNFITEIDRELVPVSEKGLHELEHCFKKLVQLNIDEGGTQEQPCQGCNEKSGNQRLVEILKLGTYLNMSVEKLHKS